MASTHDAMLVVATAVVALGLAVWGRRTDHPDRRRRRLHAAAIVAVVAVAISPLMLREGPVGLVLSPVEGWRSLVRLAPALLMVGGALAVQGTFFNWCRQRRNCPRCAFDMRVTPGRRCPECGHEARSESRLHRIRRCRAMQVVGLVTLAVALGAMRVESVVELGWRGMVPDRVLIWTWPWLPDVLVADAVPGAGGFADGTLLGRIRDGRLAPHRGRLLAAADRRMVRALDFDTIDRAWRVRHHVGGGLPELDDPRLDLVLDEIERLTAVAVEDPDRCDAPRIRRAVGILHASVIGQERLPSPEIAERLRERLRTVAEAWAPLDPAVTGGCMSLVTGLATEVAEVPMDWLVGRAAGPVIWYDIRLLELVFGRFPDLADAVLAATPNDGPESRRMVKEIVLHGHGAASPAARAEVVARLERWESIPFELRETIARFGRSDPELALRVAIALIRCNGLSPFAAFLPDAPEPALLAAVDRWRVELETMVDAANAGARRPGSGPVQAAALLAWRDAVDGARNDAALELLSRWRGEWESRHWGPLYTDLADRGVTLDP